MQITSHSHISPVLKHCIILDEEEDSHGQTGCNSLKKKKIKNKIKNRIRDTCKINTKKFGWICFLVIQSSKSSVMLVNSQQVCLGVSKPVVLF